MDDRKEGRRMKRRIDIHPIKNLPLGHTRPLSDYLLITRCRISVEFEVFIEEGGVFLVA